MLHNIAENVLLVEEGYTPAILWRTLCWYWGSSFLGMGPRYMEYMQSGEEDIDKAFFFNEDNEDINHVFGYERPLTPKERFDRAVNFYEYCYIAGCKTSINWPYDAPPDLDTLVEFRRQGGAARAQEPNQLVNEVLDEMDPDFREMWELGGQLQREARAQAYTARVHEALDYVYSDVRSRLQLTSDQINPETGFLEEGKIKLNEGINVDDMDEVMPDETQWNKLGDVYVQKSARPEVPDTVIAYGALGAYWKAGHNLELNMYNEERMRELSYAYHATVKTWQKLREISRTLKR